MDAFTELFRFTKPWILIDNSQAQRLFTTHACNQHKQKIKDVGNYVTSQFLFI